AALRRWEKAFSDVDGLGHVDTDPVHQTVVTAEKLRLQPRCQLDDGAAGVARQPGLHGSIEGPRAQGVRGIRLAEAALVVVVNRLVDLDGMRIDQDRRPALCLARAVVQCPEHGLWHALQLDRNLASHAPKATTGRCTPTPYGAPGPFACAGCSFAILSRPGKLASATAATGSLRPATKASTCSGPGGMRR